MSFTAPNAASAAILREPQPVATRMALLGSTYNGFHPMARGPTVAFAPETDTGAADTGPLRLDDAISLLSSLGEEAEESADEADAAEDEDDPGAEDGDADADETQASDQEAAEDDAPDEDDPASEEPGEDEEAEPAEPAIDAPKFWSAEEKALFAKAPPDVQLLIAAKDQAAEKRVYEAKEEAAAARKDASVIGEFKAVIDQQVQRAQTIFQGKWDGVDWAQWARENAQEAFAAKIEHDQELEALKELRTAQAATEAEEHRQFLATEAAKLREAGHVLADREKGRAEKQKLVAYAQTQNVPAESLQWAGAVELTVLHKAMLWDEAQAKLAANPVKASPIPKKPAPAPAAKPVTSVRPTAAAPPRKAVAVRQRQEVVQKAMKSGRMDDAVAALKALEKG